MSIKILAATACAAALSAPVVAQTAGDFDELRSEIRQLRDEVAALKRAQARDAAVAPAGTPAGTARANEPPAPAPVVADAGGSSQVIPLPSQQPGNPRRTLPRASSIPGGLIVPGTETSVHLYGAVEVHAIHDFDTSSPSDNFTDLSFQPLKNSGSQTGRTKMTAETSRMGFETSTPEAAGELKTKLEMDFYAYDVGNRNRNRVRHAYAEYDGWLVGQTWSTFMDLDDLPETVDFNGPIGAPFSRRVMVRYSHDLDISGGRLAFALEDPQDQAQLGSVNSANERLPEVVLRYDQTFSWGSANIRGLTHDKRSATTSRRGYGYAIGGNYKLTEKDLLLAQYTRVDGDVDQLYGSNGYGIDANGNITFDHNQGLVLGYARAVTARLRATAAFGMNKSSTAVSADPANNPDNRRLQEAFLNAIYSPIKGVELGAEYIFGRRKTFQGEEGSLSRTDFMARYTF